MPRLNDEIILAALIASGSIRAAAKNAGISETTIRTRLLDPDFRERYETAKGFVLQEACDSLCGKLSAATDALFDVMQDDKNPAGVRCSAAEAILRHALRYVEVCTILRRIDALEARDTEGI